MSWLSRKQGPRYRHLAEEGEAYETIAAEKLTPIIGAEISGVDIARLVSDEARYITAITLPVDAGYVNKR